MRVAITGHRPDAFIQSHYTEGQVKLVADGVVATFKRQFDGNLSFNVGGAIGADQWLARACINADVPYYLYAPMLFEIQSRYWSKEQQNELKLQYEKASGITIIDPSGNYQVKNYFIRDRMMVDDADFLIAFWVGKRRGGTFETMKYALSKSKFVFNALDDLRPVFNIDLENGWTPPNMRGE